MSIMEIVTFSTSDDFLRTPGGNNFMNQKTLKQISSMWIKIKVFSLQTSEPRVLIGKNTGTDVYYNPGDFLGRSK